LPNNAEAPIPLVDCVSTGYWKGIVDGRRVIVYAGELGSDYSSDDPATGEGRVCIHELDHIDVTLDWKWLRFEGVGPAQVQGCSGSGGHALWRHNGRPFQLDLDQVVSDMK
jgi:hypothetical protein